MLLETQDSWGLLGSTGWCQDLVEGTELQSNVVLAWTEKAQRSSARHAPNTRTPTASLLTATQPLLRCPCSGTLPTPTLDITTWSVSDPYLALVFTGLPFRMGRKIPLQIAFKFENKCQVRPESYSFLAKLSRFI